MDKRQVHNMYVPHTPRRKREDNVCMYVCRYVGTATAHTYYVSTYQKIKEHCDINIVHINVVCKSRMRHNMDKRQACKSFKIGVKNEIL